MKTFKQLIAEVAQPNNEDELNFKAKHSIEVMDYPASEESQHSAEKKSPRRRADYAEGEDEDVYEAKKLDPVGKANADIDNDGDTDDSDEYLHARRAAIAKAMKEAIEKKLDPVGKANADIDNDGDTDDSDEFLHARRAAIAKAMKKEKGKKSDSLEEKAVSQDQQQAAGVALAVKRGDKPKSALIGASKEMYKMAEKDLEDFAKTKHKGLPVKIQEATPTKKEITTALQSIKAQPKEKVTLKKAPWNEQKEEVSLDEAVAGSQDCWPGYRKVGTKMGTGINAGKRVNDCQKITEASYSATAAAAGKDIGKPGKEFEKIAKDAGERYGSEERGKKVAGAILAKLRAKNEVKEEVNQIDEDATLDQIRAILTKKNDGTKVVKDKSGYFHIKTANSHKGPFHTMKDVLADLTEGTLIVKAAAAHNDGKKKFNLDDKEFPVTIKPSTAKKIVKEKVELDENFKVGAVKLNDGSSVIIKEADAKLLNQLVSELADKNREAMMKAAMKDKKGFNEILGFAKEAL